MEDSKRCKAISHQCCMLALASIALILALAGCSSSLTTSGTPQASAAARQRSPTSTFSPQPSATRSSSKQQIPNFSHIFEIVLENTSYSHIIGSAQAPYLNQLARQYGLASQFYAITHPSLPNYFALTGGSTFGISSDCDLTTPSCPQQATNLVDEIEQSGRTWAAYFESMATPCDTTRQPPYTIHINPFVYYTDIVTNAQRCQSHILPYNQAQFFDELNKNAVPNYVWLGPNLDNDMHNGTISQSDSWLSTTVSQIVSSRAFQDGGLVILTFDEGDDGSVPDTAGCCNATPGGGHIATLLLSPLVHQGYTSTIPENLYALLRTIEDAWGLPPLGQSAGVAPMSEFFS
jgi:hypothetical protein